MGIPPFSVDQLTADQDRYLAADRLPKELLGIPVKTNPHIPPGTAVLIKDGEVQSVIDILNGANHTTDLLNEACDYLAAEGYGDTVEQVLAYLEWSLTEKPK